MRENGKIRDLIIEFLSANPDKAIKYKEIEKLILEKYEIDKSKSSAIKEELNKLVSDGLVIKDKKGNFKAQQIRRINSTKLTKKDKEFLLKKAKQKCQICSKKVDETNYEIGHDVPVVKGGKFILDNMMILCKDCNKIKGKNYPYNWLLKTNDISAGLYIPERELFIIGYKTGNVEIYSLNKRELKKIHEVELSVFDSIRSITRYEDKSKILIGSLDSGNSMLLDLDNFETIILEKGIFSKHNRLFTSSWYNEKLILTGSTYGTLNVFILNEGEFKKNVLFGHSHGIFGISTLDSIDKMISGDYKGNIYHWEFSDEQFKLQEKVYGIRETIQAITWNKSGNYYATLGKRGTIQIFEKFVRKDETNWALLLRYLSGSGMGKFITFSIESEKLLYAITSNEIIALNYETTGIFRYPIKNCLYLYEIEDSLIVISEEGIFRILTHIPDTKLYDHYKFAKVGVIGHASAGKSTLCKGIQTGIFDPNLKSTLMNTVWDWDYLDEDTPYKITLHDFGGQANIIPAHLPHLIDSDIIMIIYSQRSVTTFNIAIDLRDKLIDEFKYKNPILFIQTNCDNNDNVDADIATYNESNKDKQVNPIKTGVENQETFFGLEELKEELIEIIKSGESKVQIISKETQVIYDLIVELQRKHIEDISLREIYDEIQFHFLDLKMSDLLYVLNGLSIQGKIELRKKNDKIIVYLNMDRIHEAKNNILREIHSRKREGFIVWDEYLEIKNEVEKEYAEIAIDMLISDNTCIKHNDQIFIFDFLKDIPDETDIDFHSRNNLFFNEENGALIISKDFSRKLGLKPENWITIFIDLNLKIGTISKSGGIFYYVKNNAYCYVSIETPTDVFNQRCTFNVKINGESDEIKNNLFNKLKIILDDFFDSTLEIEEIKTDTGKKAIAKKKQAKEIELNSDVKSTKTDTKNDEINFLLLNCNADSELSLIIIEKFQSLNFHVDSCTLSTENSIIEQLSPLIKDYDYFLLLNSNNFIQKNWTKMDLEFISNPKRNQGKLMIVQYSLADSDINQYDISLLKSVRIILNDSEDLNKLTESDIQEKLIHLYQINCFDPEIPLFDVDKVDVNFLESFKETIDLVIFTAVEIERNAILKKMNPLEDQRRILQGSYDGVEFFIGILGSYDIVLTMTGKGSSEAQETCRVSFDFWKPKVSMMCGIGFGAKKTSQKIADIMVSSQIILYEPKRVGVKTIARGSKPDCSPFLLKYFSNIVNWNFKTSNHTRSKIHIGPILTGDKLIDQAGFLDELKKEYPDAIGGEMEGAGYYKSALKRRVHWILFKAICDWGHDKTDNFQLITASAATSLLEHVLSDEFFLNNVK